MKGRSAIEYERDGEGRRVLVGLTWDETSEFRKLDRSLPFDGQHVWPTEGLPQLPMEQRWQELWTKHMKALAARRRA